MTFSGFEQPKENWSKLPHAFINALDKITSLAELKVILYILRHTWGYQEFDKAKRITLDEFQNGRKRRDGSRLDNGVGMSKNAIKDGLERAARDGFIIQTSDGRDAARNSHEYQLVMASEIDSRGSEVDTLRSEVDIRSEKETVERNLERHVASDATPSQEKPSAQSMPSEKEPTGNALLDAFGIQRAPHVQVTPTPSWQERTSETWTAWGSESEEFQRQLARFGERGRRVQHLGDAMDAQFGLRPNWKKPKEVRGWAAGLSDCLERAEDDERLVLQVAQRARADGLTIANPYSLHKMISAAIAERRSPAAGASRAIEVFT